MSDFPPYFILFQFTIFKEKSELWLTTWFQDSLMVTIYILKNSERCDQKESFQCLFLIVYLKSRNQESTPDLGPTSPLLLRCCERVRISPWTMRFTAVPIQSGVSLIILLWFILSFFDLINLFHKPLGLGRKIWVWIQASFVKHPP